jgi:hypothetical protein
LSQHPAVAYLFLVRPMTTRLTIGLCIASLLPASAHGRVWETVKQVEARYGKPQRVLLDRPDLREVGYVFRGFMVLVYYSGGISRRESFSRWPRGGRLPPLSRDTVQEILAFSTPQGQSWLAIPAPHVAKKETYYWVSSDRRTIAFFVAPGGILLFRDPNFHADE